MAAVPRLTLRFALYAGIALVLAAAVGAWLARSDARAQARERLRTDAVAIAEQLAGDDLASLALQRPVRGAIVADLDELFRLAPGITRITLYDRNGLITYSTDHGLIGKRADREHVRAALEGHSTLREGGYLRDFTPVRWLLSDSSFPNGVLAVDYDWAPVAKSIRHDTFLQVIAITVALLLLYGASVPILRRLTAALRKSEAQYRLIVETAAEGVWLVDESGRTVFANEKLARLLGYELGELLGRPLTDFVDGVSRAAVEDGRLRGQRDLVLLRKDGSPVYATVAASPVEDGGALVMVTDVTGRKHMAADFSNLITAITGYTDLLLDQLDADDPRHRGVERIRDAADAAVTLTRQMREAG